MRITALAALAAITATAANAASYSPRLDINDPMQLLNATTSALKNLMSYFPPGETGVYNQAQVPWATSGMIWMAYMDYLKYTADGQFSNTVTEALVNMSYGTTLDYLDGAQAGLQATILGKWNDDILWPAQAAIAGAEIYGYQTIINSSKGAWIAVPQKTYDQTYQDRDLKCGGGIYWSRDRNSPSHDYKSTITQLEFIQTGARLFIQTSNQTTLRLATEMINWMWTGGLANYVQGTIWDGVEIGACDIYEVSQWSYNYGEMIGALAWMHKATGNQTYLDIATPFLNTAITTFFASNGILTEKCERDRNCNRDQMTFKGILMRNMAYLYRETNNTSVRNTIKNALDTTLAAMIDKSCDVNWNCGGNYTMDTAPVFYSQSQYVASALLISVLGIHTQRTGPGLLTSINVATLNTTAVNTGTQQPRTGSGNPYVTSVPLGAAAELRVGAVVSVLALGLSLLV